MITLANESLRELAEQVQTMNKHLEEQEGKFRTLNNRVAGYKTSIKTLEENYKAAQVAVGDLNKTNTKLLTNFTNSFQKMEQIVQSLTDKATLETKAREKLQERVAKDQIEMQQKLQKNEEKLYIAETHSNERHHAEITKLKQKIEESEIKFKKVREIAKHDAEYELYQQTNELQKDHRRKYELLQEEVLKLKKENEVFRAREKDFDIRDLKEKLKATEVALAKTREQAEK